MNCQTATSLKLGKTAFSALTDVEIAHCTSAVTYSAMELYRKRHWRRTSLKPNQAEDSLEAQMKA